VTKFEATKVIHSMIESQKSMAEYHEGEMKKQAETEAGPTSYVKEALAMCNRDIAALTLAGEALTGEA